MTSENNVHKLVSGEQQMESAINATRHVDPLRVNTKGGPPTRDHCEVLVEDVLTIKIEGVDSFAMMCTPNDSVALAVGYLFSEGMIAGASDITHITHQTDPHVVTIRGVGAEATGGGRDLIKTSSGGKCGSRDIDNLLGGLEPGKNTLRISPAILRDVAEQMRTRQDLFALTGGAHAVAIFSAEGEIITMKEDIGRHNALDKAVGRCLLDKRPMRECGVMLSGRISLEMVAKAAQAGLELVAAVSAPSSLAIDAADRSGITLCGFVRADRATVYTHPHRFQGIDLPNSRIAQKSDG